ncbi:MAG: FAD-dependent 5-carboxymethylaminomethyl-2-thiouridine(34) oxidoreductase MnmC [Alphaproteobacteria bacterium]
MKIAIIGAGLAGLSCHQFLKQYVSDLEIYEAGSNIASAASGNDIGAVNPRLSAFKTPESEFYSAAYSNAVRFFDRHGGAFDWHKCGALHLITDEKKEKRYAQTLENWGWPQDYMRLLTVQQASEVSGIDLQHKALHLSQSGFLNPKKLCAYYASGAKIKFGAKITSLKDIKADIIILACGQGLRSIKETKHLPLGAVRGQITHVDVTAKSSALRCNLHYGGYCTPALNGTHIIGASFQRWLDHSDIIEQDDQDNIDKLVAVAPNLCEGLQVTGQKASVRTTSNDHFPVIGALPGYDNVFISAAHGSHGIISSFAGARLLADMIMRQPLSLPRKTLQALSPQRFLKGLSG